MKVSKLTLNRRVKTLIEKSLRAIKDDNFIGAIKLIDKFSENKDYPLDILFRLKKFKYEIDFGNIDSMECHAQFVLDELKNI